MLRLALASLAAAAVWSPAAPAAAQTFLPCLPDLPQPACVAWTGTVTFVADGDTIDVDVDDDGVPTPVRVRIAGVQAMEQTAYSRVPARRSGDCHAVEATGRLEELIAASGGRVRLTAQDPGSRSRTRLRRSVAVLIDGQWVDVGRALIAEGHALWLPNRREYAWNETYNALSQAAAAARTHLWDPAYCGGPPAALKLWVHWDADGPDGQRPDDEWVRVRNLDTSPVDLSGWMLRDSALHRFWFPAGTILPAGGTITVQVGLGSGALLSWGLGSSIFANVDGGIGTGDGAYLFDPQGGLRAWMIYPCRVGCGDPNVGRFDVRVQASGRETVSIRSTAPGPVDLDGYELRVDDRSYAFSPGTIVEPGETLRLRTDGSPSADTRLDRTWSGSGQLLPNRGGAARLQTYDGIVLACDAWGDGAC